MTRRNRLIAGYILIGWPLPVSIGIGVHLNGWKITAVIFGGTFLALLILAYGVYLLNEARKP